MSIVLTEPITGPSAWRGCDLRDDPSWRHPLSNADIDAIDTALTTARERGATFPAMRREDFPLPALAPMLSTIAESLENGPGFALLRGLPVARYTDAEIATITYGIGLHMGTPVGQNPAGDLLGTVTNIGDPADKSTRVYQTNLTLPYHTDPSDVVGLLCLRKAKRGGLSSLVSAASVYNTLLDHHRELLGLYYRPFHYAHLAADGTGRSPLFSWYRGKLACRYLRQYIELGHETEGDPLSPVEVAALDAFDAATRDDALRLDMMLEPGDLQFANNYAVLHSRTDFEDSDDPNARRKMLRLWLRMPNARPLAPEFPGRNGFDTA